MSADGQTDAERRIETVVIDPGAPVRFVRLLINGKERAMIPWDEAVAIGEAVEQYDREQAEADR